MNDFEKFFYSAVRFLSFRPRSEKETRDRLLQKKAPKEVIDKIILKLKTQKLIDDGKFARWWIEQRRTFKHASQKLIKLELRQKGIADEIIESSIMDMSAGKAGQESGGDLGQAKEIVKQKIEKYKHLPKREIYQKLGAFLGRKGFDWETIKQSIDESVSK